MKKIILITLLIFPQFLFAQKVITLAVNQPPEFGFSVSKQDTTIIKGNSVVLGYDLIIKGGSGIYQYSWSPGVLLDDSTTIHPVATPADTTSFILTVTDSLGCSFSVNYVVNVREHNLSTQQFPVSGNLKAVLFPNPNDGTFSVQLTGNPVEKIDLTVYDSSGKAITKQVIRNFTGEYTKVLRLKLTSGIYTLLIDAKTEKLSRQFVIR